MDAAVWREDAPKWTNEDEWAAQTLEAVEAWGTRLFRALTGADIPEPERLAYPDRPEPERPEPKITTDPQEIAAFFGLKERG